ncbi:protein TolQ [Candidatus Nitrosacidococcus tergens]|uniref:Tol-Pal system protein TolQ n=1 Tax=Candidatus Nitrosacidococcus tergens TaxID=553981 RepID=A0A7G1QBU9_9GAMM|nr:protein TolQ [Candidatus Nitrosacidococcus tergens]CAB1277453.1 membrane spanning protein in TolA-TolQ-TolR complex [Candidatus Nitrosacidococcus tergens]
MANHLSVFDLILEASLLVQLVMLILLVISIISWTLIFRKRNELQLAKSTADSFEDYFWSGQTLNNLYTQLSTHEPPLIGIEGIFFSGFKEFTRLYKEENIEKNAALDGIQRAMRISLTREIDILEDSLPFLATAGSISPYIGLFGTVWGIMSAFRGLGDVHQATLAMVAPGIAEALVATAMGLFAAIPAAIAYNRYTNEIDRLISRYNTFSEELFSIFQRQMYKS